MNTLLTPRSLNHPVPLHTVVIMLLPVLTIRTAERPDRLRPATPLSNHLHDIVGQHTVRIRTYAEQCDRAGAGRYSPTR